MKYEERKKNTVVVCKQQQQAKESERLNNFEHVADWCGVRKVNTFFSLSISPFPSPVNMIDGGNIVQRTIM